MPYLVDWVCSLKARPSSPNRTAGGNEIKFLSPENGAHLPAGPQPCFAMLPIKLRSLRGAMGRPPLDLQWRARGWTWRNDGLTQILSSSFPQWKENGKWCSFIKVWLRHSKQHVSKRQVDTTFWCLDPALKPSHNQDSECGNHSLEVPCWPPSPLLPHLYTPSWASSHWR